MVACEVATLPLKAGLNLSNKSTPEAKTFDDAARIISAQPGYEGCWYGTEVESPNILQMWINWKSLDDHKKFMGSSDYQPLLSALGSIMDGAPDLYHFEPKSAADQKKTFGAPVTECLTFHLASKDATFESNLEKFLAKVGPVTDGFLGSVGGWSIEEVEHEKFGEGKKGKIYFAALGWTSIEAHMACRETDVFKNNIKLIAEHPLAREVHHVHMQQL